MTLRKRRSGDGEAKSQVSGVKAVEARIAHGTAYEEIIRTARDVKADMIVIGTRPARRGSLDLREYGRTGRPGRALSGRDRPYSRA